MSIDEDTYDENAYQAPSPKCQSAINDLKSQRDEARACCAGLLRLLHTSSADLDVFVTDVGPRATIKRSDGKYHVSVQEMGS